jgi:hypothetical protein
MATTGTRLLLLGVVAVFEPVNGYRIRCEPVSWHVEEWADLNPGSVYIGLAPRALTASPSWGDAGFRRDRVRALAVPGTLIGDLG